MPYLDSLHFFVLPKSCSFRLAPEHLYPAAFNDSFAVTAALADGKGSHLGIDGSALSVAGDSSGGSLAAGVALAWRDSNRRPLRAQILIYPVLQLVSFQSPSYLEAKAYGLDADCALFSYCTYLWGDLNRMQALANQSTELLPENTWALIDRRLSGENVKINMPSLSEFPHADKLLSTIASPLLVSPATGLPPSILLLAGIDFLRSDGERFAEKLRSAGVEVEVFVYKHQVHGFHTMVSLPSMPFVGRQLAMPEAEDVLDNIQTFMRRYH